MTEEEDFDFASATHMETPEEILMAEQGLRRLMPEIRAAVAKPAPAQAPLPVTPAPQPAPTARASPDVSGSTFVEPPLEPVSIVPPAPSPVPEIAPPAKAEPPRRSQADGESAAFRPMLRPPVPRLCVCDDGKNDGEVIRIRDRSFVIGRTEGQLTIPADQLISARHAEIALETDANGETVWVVRDLASSHGTFFRARKTPLENGSELLIGSGKYRFVLAGDSPDARPSLVELFPGGASREMTIEGDEFWIGRDPACEEVRADDPFTEGRHAKIHRDSRGVWVAINNNSANGLWVRLARLEIRGESRFQMGEQRFQLTVS